MSFIKCYKEFIISQSLQLKCLDYAQSFNQQERVNCLCKRYIIFSYSYVMSFNILTKGKIITALLKLNTKEYLKVRHFIWLLEVYKELCHSRGCVIVH